MAAFVAGAAGFIGLAVTEALPTRGRARHRLRSFGTSAMAIDRLRGDTALLPRYNLAEALSDYLQWLGPAFEMGAPS